MSEKDFQDSLACEQISKINKNRYKKQISKISKISLACERENNQRVVNVSE